MDPEFAHALSEAFAISEVTGETNTLDASENSRASFHILETVEPLDE